MRMFASHGRLGGITVAAVLAALAIAPAGAEMFDQFNQMQRRVPQRTPGGAVASVNQAIVRAMTGTVRTRARAAKIWTSAQPGAGLNGGDSVQTSSGATAELSFADGTTVRLAQSSTMTLNEGARRGLRLLLGKLWSKVVGSSGHGMSVHTPAAIASVVGTELSVGVDGGKTTTVAVTEGRVQVTGNKGQRVMVAAGSFTTVTMGRAPAPVKPLSQLKEIDAGTALVIDPKVAVTNPTSDALLTGYQVIEVLVDPGMKGVEYVEFAVDGQVQYMANVAPYRFRLDTRTLGNGRHTLQAIAHWADKDVTISKEIPVQVNNGGQPVAPAVPPSTSSPPALAPASPAVVPAAR